MKKKTGEAPLRPRTPRLAPERRVVGQVKRRASAKPAALLLHILLLRLEGAKINHKSACHTCLSRPTRVGPACSELQCSAPLLHGVCASSQVWLAQAVRHVHHAHGRQRLCQDAGQRCVRSGPLAACMPACVLHLRGYPSPARAQCSTYARVSRHGHAQAGVPELASVHDGLEGEATHVRLLPLLLPATQPARALIPISLPLPQAPLCGGVRPHKACCARIASRRPVGARGAGS